MVFLSVEASLLGVASYPWVFACDLVKVSVGCREDSPHMMAHLQMDHNWVHEDMIQGCENENNHLGVQSGKRNKHNNIHVM